MHFEQVLQKPSKPFIYIRCKDANGAIHCRGQVQHCTVNSKGVFTGRQRFIHHNFPITIPDLFLYHCVVFTNYFILL